MSKSIKQKQSCIVVIPVYQQCINAVEARTLENNLKVLTKHDICLLCPSSLNLTCYENIARHVGKELQIERFDDRYFTSVNVYNELCFSGEFYDRFALYEYMLICQLDAWVFNDQLDYWCGLGYDYVGAPIYFPYNTQHFTKVFSGIGNGGFNLRRISHCQKILCLNRNKTFLKPFALLRIYFYSFIYNEKYSRLLRRISLIPLCIAKMFGYRNTLERFISQHTNEDMLLGTWAAQSWLTNCKVPDEQTAMRFSFEVHPSWLYERTDNQLPFGCHAFMKWEYETFWKNHIKIE